MRKVEYWSNWILQPGRAVWGVLIASICVVLLFWAVLPDRAVVEDSPDYAHFYEPIARELVAGNGFFFAGGKPATRFTPGFPLILAGVFAISDHSVALSVFIVLCAMLVAVGIYQIVLGLFSPAHAFWAALIATTYPMWLWCTKQPGSELPFMALFILFVAVLLRGVDREQPATLLAAGMICGMAILVRPIGLGLPALAVVFVAWAWQSSSVPWKKIILGIASVSLGALIVILPWETFLYQQTGRVVLLSTGGSNSMVDGMTFAVNPRNYRKPLPLPDDVAELMRSILVEHDAGIEHSPGDLATHLWATFLNRPSTILKLVGFKMRRSLYGTDSTRFELPSIVIQSSYGFFALLGGWLVWREGNPKRRRYIVLVGSITLYFWGMTILVLPLVRYMVPAFLMLITLTPAVFLRSRYSE